MDTLEYRSVIFNKREKSGPNRQSIASQLADLESCLWDVVILGAGVAGTAAAILAAKRGLKTLLVEAKPFPREKVCGGCLNRRAQRSLERLGVLNQIQLAGSIRIDSMHLQILATSVIWPVPAMISVRRSTLDTLLVDEAVTQGCKFIDSAHGSLVASESKTRLVRIQKQDQSVVVEAKCVLIASGLTRSPLKNPTNWPAVVHDDSRIGVQCMLAEKHAAAYVGNQLHMLVGKNGYAGICSTDGNCVDIAAAIDPASIQTLGGIEHVIRGILEECNAPSILWPDVSPWMATPALTRNSSRVVDRCVFLIGDAIGYVEPFTGEGMSWALASAEAVMPHVIEIAHKEWNDRMADQWSDWAVRQRIQKQKTCRWIAKRIRRPRGAAWVLRACNWFPPLRSTIIRKTTQ